MAANGKGTQSAPQSAYASVTGMLAEWIRQGTDGFVATHKILLDLAAQQNALVLTLMRERLGFATLQAKSLAEFTSTGVKNLNNVMEAGRVILDAMTRQNAILADGLLSRAAGTPLGRMAEVLRQEIDNIISTQKEFLDVIEIQAEGALNDFGERKGFDSARLSDLARNGVSTFVKSQKRLMEIVEDQLAEKAPSAADDKKPALDPAEMANKSVNSLIDAQRKLLDLAAGQIQTNLKFAREMFTVESHPATTLAELARKSVDSFVAAQKALAELAAKPRQEPETVPDDGAAAGPMAAHG